MKTIEAFANRLALRERSDQALGEAGGAGAMLPGSLRIAAFTAAFGRGRFDSPCYRRHVAGSENTKRLFREGASFSWISLMKRQPGLPLPG